METVGSIIGMVIGVLFISYIGFNIIRIIFFTMQGIFRFIKFQSMTPEQKQKEIRKQEQIRGQQQVQIAEAVLGFGLHLILVMMEVEVIKHHPTNIFVYR